MSLGTVILLSLGLLASGCSTPATVQAPGSSVTAFEGARLIAGDGSAPIDNATFIVDGARFAQVGPSGEVQIPAGARRVDLKGKTVIPALIDTHTHMAREREPLIDQLQGKAYYGVAAVLSLGQD